MKFIHNEKLESVVLFSTYYVEKFASFYKLHNVNEFYMLQNEFFISHKNVTIPYITYYSYKNLPSIVRELPWAMRATSLQNGNGTRCKGSQGTGHTDVYQRQHFRDQYN